MESDVGNASRIPLLDYLQNVTLPTPIPSSDPTSFSVVFPSNFQWRGGAVKKEGYDFLFLSLPLSLSHTHTHTLTYIYTHAHTHTHPHIFENILKHAFLKIPKNQLMSNAPHNL